MIKNYTEKLEAFIIKNDEISMVDLLNIIGTQSSSLVLLLILSILNIMLAPLPINSFIIGVPLIFFSFCYLFKIRELNHSNRFLKKTTQCISWRKFIKKISFYLNKVSVISKPRYELLFCLHKRLLSGSFLLIISLLIFLPIPLINTSGSITTIIVLLGIIQRDGLMLVIGYCLICAHVLFCFLIFYTVFF